MALILGDRIKETTTVAGTGTATLLGATTGFQSFAAVGNGNTTYYCIADQGGPNWEVGIGTYTASGTTLARTTVLASSNAGALVVFTAGVKDVFVTYPSEKGVWYDASGNVLFTGTTTATNLAYTGTLTGSTGILNIGSGQLYKDASGNVGIGTSSPLRKLDVSVGGMCFSDAGGGARGIIWIDSSTSISCVGIQGSGASGYLAFNTNTFGSAATERMRIDASGNVGIGTSSPTAKLDVIYTGSTPSLTASALSGIKLGVSGLSCLSVTVNPASPYDIGLQARHNSVDGFSYPLLLNPLGGNVGIGTSSPQAKLSVSNSGAAGFEFFTNASGGGVGTYIQSYNRSGAAFVDTAYYASSHTWRTNSSATAMVLDASGNVGIGTSSPSQKLHIASDGYNFRMSNGGNSFGYNLGRNVGDGLLYFYGDQSGNTGYVFSGANGERMRIDSYGNVGIGTSSPGANIRLSLIELTNTAPYQLRLGHNNTSYNYDIGRSASLGLLVFYGNQTGATGYIFGGIDGERMRIDSSGNVGIGTSSPTPANGKGLIIYEATYPRLTLRNSATGAGATDGYGLVGVGNDLFVENSEVGNLVFTTSNTERMRIDSSGNLLVGTTSALVTPSRIAIVYPGLTTWGIGFKSSYLTGNGQPCTFINSSNAVIGYISTDGTSTSYVTSSDYRLKENVVPITDSLLRVMNLKPSRFNFISEADRTVDGFLAHEAQEVVPECVIGTKDALNEDGTPNYQGIDQAKLVPLLTAAIQELKAIIDTQQEQINSLLGK